MPVRIGKQLKDNTKLHVVVLVSRHAHYTYGRPIAVRRKEAIKALTDIARDAASRFAIYDLGGPTSDLGKVIYVTPGS